MKYIIAQNLGGNEGCTMDYIIEVLFFRGLVGGGGGWGLLLRIFGGASAAQFSKP